MSSSSRDCRPGQLGTSPHQVATVEGLVRRLSPDRTGRSPTTGRSSAQSPRCDDHGRCGGVGGYNRAGRRWQTRQPNGTTITVAAELAGGFDLAGDSAPVCQDGGMSIPDSAQPRPTPTSASYSITVRIYAPPDSSVVGRLATAVSEAGGLVTAMDVSESRHDRITIDLTCSAVNGAHASRSWRRCATWTASRCTGCRDRTFLLHLGGKISVESKVPLQDPRRPLDGLHPRRRPCLAGSVRATPRTSRG